VVVQRRLAAGLALAALLAPTLAAADPATPGAPGLPPGVIASGVTIDGVPVGGLKRVPATQLVLRERVVPRLRPLVATFRGRRLTVSPRTAGYSADVAYAVKAALAFGRNRPLLPQVNVPLRETVNLRRVRAVLRKGARRLNRPPVSAAVWFDGALPRVRRARVGVGVDVRRADDILARALLTRERERYRLPGGRVLPDVTSVGSVIVIERGTLKLKLYEGERRVRSFPIAAGQAAYPTPAGRYEIITKQRDPTWFPPSSPWARGLGPVPPGVGNPLGTRWMGTSAPAIGIHGTPVAGSIGTYASHGCIRMYIHDAEWLYDHIDIGTTVQIV
jgi:hypothetical protein